MLTPPNLFETALCADAGHIVVSVLPCWRQKATERFIRAVPAHIMCRSPRSSKVEPPPRQAFPWHARTVDECLRELGLPPETVRSGLSSAVATERLRTYGANKMSEKRQKTLLQRVWKHLANALVAILLFVALVSVVRAITSTDQPNRVSNWLQAALILTVIT